MGVLRGRQPNTSDTNLGAKCRTSRESVFARTLTVQHPTITEACRVYGLRTNHVACEVVREKKSAGNPCYWLLTVAPGETARGPPTHVVARLKIASAKRTRGFRSMHTRGDASSTRGVEVSNIVLWNDHAGIRPSNCRHMCAQIHTALARALKRPGGLPLSARGKGVSTSLQSPANLE